MLCIFSHMHKTAFISSSLPSLPPSFPLAFLFSFFPTICPFPCLCLSVSHSFLCKLNLESYWNKHASRFFTAGCDLADNFVSFLGVNWSSSVTFSQKRWLTFPKPVSHPLSCPRALAQCSCFLEWCLPPCHCSKQLPGFSQLFHAAFPGCPHPQPCTGNCPSVT